MTEAVKQLLGAIGFSKESIAQMGSDEFNAVKTAEDFNNTQKELFLAKHKDSILDQYKKETEFERFQAYEKPLKQRLKRSGLFSEEDLNKTVKELIEGLSDRVDAKTKMDLSKDMEQHLKEKRELQDKYDGFVSEKESEVLKMKEALEAAQKSAANEIQRFKVEQYMTGLYRNKDVIQFDNDDKIEAYAQLLTPKILAMAQVDPATGEVVAPDGTTKVIKPDGKSFYGTVSEIVNDLAEQYKLKASSNGGKRSDGLSGLPLKMNGKDVDRAGSASIKEMLGV